MLRSLILSELSIVADLESWKGKSSNIAVEVAPHNTDSTGYLVKEEKPC
jgi:hypothetical protein